jgi:metal-responsive CopG/Arc/MetJ family transcriptional regulator
MSFFSHRRIKLDKNLYSRLETVARQAGYSSTDELIRHVLEREVSSLAEKSDQEEAERQLRGLGYLE